MPVSEHMVIDVLANLMITHIIAVCSELDINMKIRSTGMAEAREIELIYDESEQQRLQDSKEAFRSALRSRGLDVMMVRRIMRIVYATTVEEP